MVAVIQLAITLGATLGGLLYDAMGYQATFIASGVFLLIAAALALFVSRSDPAKVRALRTSHASHRETGSHGERCAMHNRGLRYCSSIKLRQMMIGCFSNTFGCNCSGAGMLHEGCSSGSGAGV